MSVAVDTAAQPASVLSADERQAESLELGALLALFHGANLVPVSRKEISRGAVSRRDRLHVWRRFVDSDAPSARPLDILVKYSDPKKNSKSVFDFRTCSILQGHESFSTPRYYGQLTALEKSIGASIGVWEYIPQDVAEKSLFRRPGVRAAVVDAAAALTAMGRDVGRAVPALPANPKFLRPVAERLGSLADGAGYFGLGKEVCCEQLAKLGALEQPAIAKLTDLGGYLTHNDLQPKNFVFREGQPLVIYDWESASLGAPGASLSYLYYLEGPELLRTVYRYCFRLIQEGMFLRPTDVLFAMRASAIFRILSYHAFNSKGGPVKASEGLARALKGVDALGV